jgi:NTE family protein
MTRHKLVISGGGVRGISAMGALAYLHDNNELNDIIVYCGTSVGAIICSLLNIGYIPKEIFNITKKIDFGKIFICDIDKILDNKCIGLYSSENIISIIGKLFQKKMYPDNITFRELYEKTQKKLIITGVCLNDVSLHYFSHESCPDMCVLKAIQISIAVPFLFKPVYYDNKIWVDGGCLNNFPINLFDECENVIGIYLGFSDINMNNMSKFFFRIAKYLVTNVIERCSIYYDKNINSVVDYFSQITKCLLNNDVFKINLKKYKNNIIYLNVGNIINWKIDKDEKKKLYNYGYNFKKKNII